LGVEKERFKMENNVNIVEANLDNKSHQNDIIAMTLAYARDEWGSNSTLSEDTLRRLIPGLKAIPTSIVFLGYINTNAVGIATCFMGFSTFNARPLLNIHDIAVLPEYRKMGVSRLLMEAVEEKARQLGCCKLTLEVNEQNSRAKHVYEAAGFGPAIGGRLNGKTLFYVKRIST
jgi:ribosomal protein S18 acetylase RimI-like enzyme